MRSPSYRRCQRSCRVSQGTFRTSATFGALAPRGEAPHSRVGSPALSGSGRATSDDAKSYYAATWHFENFIKNDVAPRFVIFIPSDADCDDRPADWISECKKLEPRGNYIWP